ncbi:hypothetical protein SAMD00024442_30_32 [Candidatus Symbiothrix dinenymphae]|nr:hypothetical protein SAMD00024442_30_32 [Candidatus Symbiothrix dinenymphae]
MNGFDFVADTNTLIYVLEGHPVMKGFMRCSVAVSVMSEIELLGKKGISSSEIDEIRSLLADCEMIGVSDEIKEIAITLKQQRAIKIPDALIAATAIHFGLTLITADKGFKNILDLNAIILDLH